MSNVLRFPMSPHVHRMMADEYSSSVIRQELGAAIGLLHMSPTDDDLRQIAKHIRDAVTHLDCMISVREACK